MWFFSNKREHQTVDILIHAHYKPELLFILSKVEQLRHIDKRSFRVLVFITDNLDLCYVKRMAPYAEIFEADAVGRNFSSILAASKMNLLKSEYVAHVHTKRSPHLPFAVGKYWFRYLVFWIFFWAKHSELSQRPIFYPRLGIFFRARSKTLWGPSGHFIHPDAIDQSNKIFHPTSRSFPIGGMFIARRSALQNWAQHILRAEPIFRMHQNVHGETEHFLERHIAGFIDLKPPNCSLEE